MWILVIMIGYGGVSTHSVEFDNKKNCEIAQDKIEDSGFGRLVTYCFKK